jgi:uncharacterized damage-inducible protein DinB
VQGVTGDEREILILEPIADHAEVGRWLSAMEDGRRDTLRELVDVDDAMVDRRVVDELNTIGTLLYHVALVEADWLLDDIFGDRAAWPSDVLPFGDRDPKGVLTEVRGESLAEHLGRLASVRTLFLGRMRPMTVEDFHTPRARERYDVSPAWVLHHLLQHEAEHRAHIAWLRDRQRAQG